MVKAVRILEREILTGMRLLGATNVSELVPEMVSLLAIRTGSNADIDKGGTSQLATALPICEVVTTPRPTHLSPSHGRNLLSLNCVIEEIAYKLQPYHRQTLAVSESMSWCDSK